MDMNGSISRWRHCTQWLRHRFLHHSVIAILVLSAIATVNVAPAQAGLAQGNAITDPNSILQYALPIDNSEVRKLQKSLEDVGEGLRTARWSLVDSNLKAARRSLKYGDQKILADIPAEHQAEAEDLIAQLRAGVDQLLETAEVTDETPTPSEPQPTPASDRPKKTSNFFSQFRGGFDKAVKTGDTTDLLNQFKGGVNQLLTTDDTNSRGKAKKIFKPTETRDKEAVWLGRRQLLTQVGLLEALMVQEFPFTVSDDYAALPQLKGRATVELITNKGMINIVADGYNAPVNAGNFIDLVQRGFYDGLPFFQNQDYIIQTGDPEGPKVGFHDPETDEYRAMPLEIKIREEEEPLYEITLEDAGYYLADLVLPFNSYGAVALARPGDDPNGGSSQFFFFLFDSELTPPGFNVLDGRYSVFAYLVEGKEVLEELEAGDEIISATVIEGLENLLEPA